MLLDILRFVVGRDVAVSDAFRLGTYKIGSIRPIMVSVRSVWDRRLILDNCRKLATGDDLFRKVFIVPDEPVDVRRNKTLRRLRDKALRENKAVDLSADGSCLYISGQLIYTVQDGKVDLPTDRDRE